MLEDEMNIISFRLLFKIKSKGSASFGRTSKVDSGVKNNIFARLRQTENALHLRMSIPPNGDRQGDHPSPGTDRPRLQRNRESHQIHRQEE